MQILNGTDVTDRASAARVIAGLDVEVETNTETRGVDIADADQGVVPDDEDDEPPELISRYDDDSSDDEDDEDASDSNSDSDGDDDSDDDEEGNNVHEEEFDEDSVGDEVSEMPSPVQRTRSGRPIRPPNNLIPTMTGKRHGNSRSRDEGVNSPLVGKYHLDDNRDNIDCQYVGAGYSTKRGVVHFNVGDDAPPT